MSVCDCVCVCVCVCMCVCDVIQNGGSKTKCSLRRLKNWAASYQVDYFCWTCFSARNGTAACVSRIFASKKCRIHEQ